MSRENYFLPLNTDKDTRVFVMVHNISHMSWNKKDNVTNIKMVDGTVVAVTQTPEAISRAGEKYGVIRELK